MASFNSARYLRPAIESVISQTYPFWELVFVDDGSNDDSVEIASRFAVEDSRILVLEGSRNRGAAAARNRALENVSGSWIAIMDSDDIMLPDRLKILMDRARQDNAELVADNLLIFSDSMTVTKPFIDCGSDALPRWIDLTTFVNSGNVYSRSPDLGYLKPMIRADLVRAGNLRYDERLRIGEDFNFLAQLLVKGTRLRLEPSCTYMYRKHAGSVSHRMTISDLVALLEADRDFVRDAVSLTKRERIALMKHRRTHEILLASERVIAMIRDGDRGKAIAATLLDPRIWGVVGRPFGARLRRLIQRVGP